MHPILDHDLISARYFFPARAALPDAVHVETPAGRLACFRSSPPGERPVLVHFHGNGELVHHWIPGFVPAIEAMGYAVFLAEYRGYGASDGTPRLVHMFEDLDGIAEAVGVPVDRTVVFGRSVGSIYAAEWVHRFPDTGGLVIESGIHDVLERLLLRVSPVELGCTMDELTEAAGEHLDHGSKLGGYTMPSLFLHAEADHLVSMSHAERNVAATDGRGRLVRLPHGDHNSVMALNQEEYLGALAAYLQERRVEMDA